MANRAILATALVWLTCFAYAGARAAAPQAASQEPAVLTVWSGVYTDAQAYRGEKVAQTTCIGCHGSGLDGGDSGDRKSVV